MPRGDNRGRGGGGPPFTPRGRGGRGGRGRGGRGGGGWKPRGRGTPGSSFLQDELDVSIYTYANAMPGGGSPAPHTPGRGRGGPQSGYSSPARGGRDSPYRGRRGRGRGIGSPDRGRGGRGGSRLRPDGPLSGLLYQERPLLRPVIFVPSVYTKTLFQVEEELLRPVVEEVGEGYENHAPTANQIERVFSGRGFPTREDSASSDDKDEEELEEVDFADLSKLLETPAQDPKSRSTSAEVNEEKFTGIFISKTHTPAPPQSEEGPMEEIDFSELSQFVNRPSNAQPAPVEKALSEVEQKFTGFVIGTDPSPVPAETQLLEDAVKAKKKAKRRKKRKGPVVSKDGTAMVQDEDNGGLREVESAMIVEESVSTVVPAIEREAFASEAAPSPAAMFIDPAIVMAVRETPAPVLDVSQETQMDTTVESTSSGREVSGSTQEQPMNAVEENATFEREVPATTNEAVEVISSSVTVESHVSANDMIVEETEILHEAVETVNSQVESGSIATETVSITVVKPEIAADDVMVEETTTVRIAEDAEESLVVSDTVTIGKEISSSPGLPTTETAPPTSDVAEESTQVSEPQVEANDIAVEEVTIVRDAAELGDALVVSESVTIGREISTSPALPTSEPAVATSEPAAEESIATGSEAPGVEAVDKLTATDLAAVEGQPAFFIDTKPTLVPSLSPRTEQPVAAPEDEQPAFFIDTQPAPVPRSQVPDTAPIVPADDEEIIVYVAPHPRSSRTASEVGEKEGPAFAPYVRNETFAAASASISAGPSTSAVPEAPPMSSLSFSFSSPVKQSFTRRQNPVRTPRATKAQVAYERKKAKRAKRAYGAFANYGAMMEEAALQGGRDKKWKSRRRGDSDIEWGSDDDRYEVMEDPEEDMFPSSKDIKGKGKAKDSFTAEGMEVDPELELDVRAMKSFVSGLMGNSAGQFKTMDDVRDEERLREEDDEEVWRGSSGDEEEEDEGQESEEVEAVFSVEEKMLIGEVDDDYDDDDDDDLDGSDDDEETPQRGFQARLERLREKARGKKAADDSFDGGQKSESDEDDEDDILQRHMTWAEEDDYFLDQIQEILAENEDVLTGRNRKADKKLFNAIRDGEFDEMDSYGSPARRKKDKWKDVPPHLREQWEKDRQKKAERKQARELEKMERAADALALKKGGKKGRKVMLAASRLDPTITVLPNRIIDMSTLVQQIRRFIAEINGPNSMSLPPTNKETRKNIHEMAEAFGLKSASKGKGDARYTTLHKTSRTGIVLNEKKISWIVRRSGGAGARGSQFVYTESSNARKGATPVVPRHKEGDEVGKAAPKINQSNIGFRMLASMGWSEGDRIGMSGGLDAPLTAIIKNTKLGLGATK